MPDTGEVGCSAIDIRQRGWPRHRSGERSKKLDSSKTITSPRNDETHSWAQRPARHVKSRSCARSAALGNRAVRHLCSPSLAATVDGWQRQLGPQESSLPGGVILILSDGPGTDNGTLTTSRSSSLRFTVCLSYVGFDQFWSYADVQEITLYPVTEIILFAVIGPFALFMIALLLLVAGLLTRPSLVRRCAIDLFARVRRLGRSWAPDRCRRQSTAAGRCISAGARNHTTPPASGRGDGGCGSYGAFMVQGTVLIGLAIAVRPIPVVAEVKALVVAGGGVAGSFALAWLLISRVPGIPRVL
jgi:hypothetical protein